MAEAERMERVARPARTREGVVLGALFALAAALRLHGAWAAPPLSGFDGPFHAANMAILLFEGRLPLPHEGWSTFHPPFYYALSAGLWALLPEDLAPARLLFALRLLNVAAGLALGWAVWVASRRVLRGRPAAALCATALALFLPMEIGPSFLVGNEAFGAAFSAWGVVALLACLAPDAGRGRLVVLGVLLGLGALTKFNTGVVAAVAGGALVLQGLVRHGAGVRALAPALGVAAIALAIAGWFYAWNLSLYGQPVLMQNEIVTAHMAKSGYGPVRDWTAYLSLRPDILALPLDMLLPASQSVASPPVWPFTFASVWFDLQSSVLLAPSPPARTAAAILYACGAAWTGLALWGVFRLLGAPRGSGRFVAGSALCGVVVASLVAYVAFTFRVATVSALKGTYLSPSVLPWCVLAGAGCEGLLARGGAAARGVLAALTGLFVATATAIFWVGWLAPLPWNPGVFYLRAHSDAATRRVYELFIGQEPPADVPAAPGRLR